MQTLGCKIAAGGVNYLIVFVSIQRNEKQCYYFINIKFVSWSKAEDPTVKKCSSSEMKNGDYVKISLS